MSTNFSAPVTDGGYSQNSFGKSDLFKAVMIISDGLSGGLSSTIAGGNFFQGFKQGVIVAGLNHLAHLAAESYGKLYVLFDGSKVLGDGHIALLGGNDSDGWRYASDNGVQAGKGTFFGPGDWADYYGNDKNAPYGKDSYYNSQGDDVTFNKESTALAWAKNKGYTSMFSIKLGSGLITKMLDSVYTFTKAADYNVFSRNCADAVVNAFKSVGFPTPYIPPLTSTVPRTLYNDLLKMYY